MISEHENCVLFLTITKHLQRNSTGGKTSFETGIRLSSARRLHHEVCSLLLSSLESLQRTLIEYSNLLTESNQEKSEAKMSVADCRKRLNNLSDMAKVNWDQLTRDKIVFFKRESGCFQNITIKF